MHTDAVKSALQSLLLGFLVTGSAAAAEDAVPDPAISSALDKIRDAAMNDDWAFRRLADLCDKIGPRLSGSPQADAAVEQIAAALKASGLTVVLQPVTVPHWTRGEEQAEIAEYP